jgi:hypothetical protein
MPFDYSPCVACHRLVKAADPSCPFCNAAMSPAASGYGTAEATLCSRAAWLAVASTVAAFAALGAGCTRQTDDPSSRTDAGAGAETDPPAASSPGADAACITPESGTFMCGGASCDVATQYCDRYLKTNCIYNGKGTNSPSNYEEASCRDRADRAPDNSFPPACLSCATCGCIGPYAASASKDSCAAIAGGGVVITHDQTTICGACYGSPPARLERLAV